MAKGFMEKRIDRTYIANMSGASAIWGGAFWIIATIFAILGIYADAANETLGLTASAWFMLAIIFHLAGISYWIAWAVGVYFRSE